jgi:hypothetical protein
VKKQTNKASLQGVVAKLELIFDTLNRHLFAGQLITPVISVSPDTSVIGSYGWCTSREVWQGEDSERYFEINLCAEHLNRPFEDVGETMLHEMVHLYNSQNKIKDTSRAGTYHNTRFKEAAGNHGLLVEKHFKYGWCMTKLSKEVSEWLKAEFPDEKDFTLRREKKVKSENGDKKSSYIKYVCPQCPANVRATKPTNILCLDCQIPFVIKENDKQSFFECVP